MSEGSKSLSLRIWVPSRGKGEPPRSILDQGGGRIVPSSSRIAKAFAIVAASMMLAVVAESNVVIAASADPPLSTPVISPLNETAPLPVPPPPPPADTPQRDVSPGTVTQGWKNSTPAQIAYHHTPTLVKSDKQLMYA